jgi:XTP/dITP diphosphohydrolase
LAAKLISRSAKAGLSVPAPAGSGHEIGEKLFAVVGEAVQAGVDPELALREVARGYRAAILRAEQPGS